MHWGMHRITWLVALVLAGCPAQSTPEIQEPGFDPQPMDGGGAAGTLDDLSQASVDPTTLGDRQDHLVDFAFDGGALEFDLYRKGTELTQIVRNRYMVPVVIRWDITTFANVRGTSPLSGSTFIPAADRVNGAGPWVKLATLQQIDASVGYRRALVFRGRWGDPRSRPTQYAYALPFTKGSTYSVLQGFHGEFSHKGSNEYAVDFDCPVATTVRASREGIVVAAHAEAVGSGNTRDFLDHKKVNFVLILHDDGTLGEYMHLAPSSLSVQAGDRVKRGQTLALSGNTGYSSTPHLHFQLMTAGIDGISALSFPFEFAIGHDNSEEPVQGKRYTAFE